MEQIHCDIAIIGAGAGGLSLAAGASQLGAKVVLIESHKMGGDCLNYGCVPSNVPTISEVSKRVASLFYTPLIFSNKMRALVRWLLKIG